MRRLESVRQIQEDAMKLSLIPGAALFGLLVGPAQAMDTSLDGLKSRIVGSWTSISCELRPQQNAEDPAKAPSPSYLTRDFKYDADGGFEANITVYADPGCAIPAASYDFAGDLFWVV